MKKIVTLSMVAMAAATMSARTIEHTGAQSRVFNAQAKAKIEMGQPTLVAEAVNPVVAPFAATTQNAVRKPASVESGAHYTPQGMLKAGIFYNEEAGAWGYSYNTPYLFGQAYYGSYVPSVGNNWTIGTSDTDASFGVDEEGNYSVKQSQMGVGGYYTPKLWSEDGNYAYFYGSDDADAPEYSVLFAGSGETVEMCAYNLYCDANLYVGYSNTAAYGSRDFVSSATGYHIQADKCLINYGDLRGYAVQKVRVLLGNTQFVTEEPIPAGAEIQVRLSVAGDDGEVTVYETVMTSDNVQLVGNWYMADVVFTEEDEDGFASEITPVINGKAELLLSGFMQEGVHCEIPMMYYNNEDYTSCSYYDYWVDGVQETTENGNVAFYCTPNTDAAVSLVGYFNYIGKYNAPGVTECYAYVLPDQEYNTLEDGSQFTWARTYVDSTYNDFTIESSFNIMDEEENDLWEFDCEADVILGFDTETDYFEDYNAVILYIAVKPLPKGETSRTSDIIITSYGSAKYVIHVLQGEAALAGLNAVKNDATDAAIYNLQGVRVNGKLAPGFYISNGKKMVIK